MPTVVAALGAARLGWLAAGGEFRMLRAGHLYRRRSFLRRPALNGAIGLVPSAVQATIATFSNVM